MKHQPPPHVVVSWCPVCGRNDRDQKLTRNHNANGRHCEGKPLPIKYIQGDVL